jgi:hypothetical protein
MVSVLGAHYHSSQGRSVHVFDLPGNWGELGL